MKNEKTVGPPKDFARVVVVIISLTIVLVSLAGVGQFVVSMSMLTRINELERRVDSLERRVNELGEIVASRNWKIEPEPIAATSTATATATLIRTSTAAATQTPTFMELCAELYTMGDWYGANQANCRTDVITILYGSPSNLPKKLLRNCALAAARGIDSGVFCPPDSINLAYPGEWPDEIILLCLESADGVDTFDNCERRGK